jgi:hypothetical protein
MLRIVDCCCLKESECVFGTGYWVMVLWAVNAGDFFDSLAAGLLYHLYFRFRSRQSRRAKAKSIA